MHSACSILPETSPNGSRIVGTTIIAMPRRTAPPGSPANAGFACCAAARSTVSRRLPTPRRVSVTIMTCATARTVSGLFANSRSQREQAPKADSMKASVGGLTALAIGALAAVAPALAQTKNADTQAPAAQVSVVRATNQCFSSLIPVTGFLVARAEAVVALSPNDRVTEVLAAEGDK